MPMTTDADAIQRIRRGFSTDAASLDALRRRGNRRGVALLFDEQGNLDEVVDLNGGAEHVEVTNEGNHVQVAHAFPEWKIEGPRTQEHRDATRQMTEKAESEPYELIAGENFERRDAQSHERSNATQGHFPPQNFEGRSTGDAPRLAAELRAKQAADAAKEKSIRLAAYQRNAEIAERGKAFWSKKSA